MSACSVFCGIKREDFMQILKSKKGRFFDPEKYAKCPFCEDKSEEHTTLLSEFCNTEPLKAEEHTTVLSEFCNNIEPLKAEDLIICFEDTLKKSNSGTLKQLTLKAIQTNRVYKENFISSVERDNENSDVEVCLGNTLTVRM